MFILLNRVINKVTLFFQSIYTQDACNMLKCVYTSKLTRITTMYTRKECPCYFHTSHCTVYSEMRGTNEKAYKPAQSLYICRHFPNTISAFHTVTISSKLLQFRYGHRQCVCVCVYTHTRISKFAEVH